ncbi:hypothetical protein [Curtobacterium sp. MCBD17_040]|uniref:hypothetical protein n=1 Tax=Curtobacterium sp. MCBD17_040 TaxID=2175674 RepID=UPI000DA6DF6A|nr:hypothetical protein [Curtobacterium sp. MCBD17_040]WIB65682.1 hypothetical protein DEI94_16305 [Curtobacterium sp. MCBD17_040]
MRRLETVEWSLLADAAMAAPAIVTNGSKGARLLDWGDEPSTFALFAKVEMPLVTALAERRYADAAQLLMPSLELALPPYSTSGGSGIAMVPEALSSRGLAAAALYPNEQVDALLRRISSAENSPQVSAYSKMLDLRAAMRAVLTAVAAGVSARKEVQAQAGLDGRAFVRAVQWLVKAGELFEDGATLSLHGRPPASAPPMEQQPVESASPSVPEPQLVDLNTLPRVLGGDTYASSREDPLTLARVPELVPAAAFAATPAPLRPLGQARALTTQHMAWLLTYKQSASERRRQWTASLIDRNGNPLRPLTLPAPLRSTVSGLDRDWVCIVDDDLHLRVYREGGELIVDVGLRQRMPNLPADLDPWTVRADYDVRTDRFAVVVRDTVWVGDESGRVLWGRRVPGKVYPSGSWAAGQTPSTVRVVASHLGLRNDLTAREAVSYLESEGLTDRRAALAGTSPARVLHEHLGEVTPDAIMEVRFTADRLLTVSTKYGLNVDLTVDGDAARLWDTGDALRVLVDDGTSRTSVTRTAVVRVAGEVIVTGSGNGNGMTAAASTAALRPDPTYEIADVLGEAVAGDGWVARTEGTTVSIVDTSSGAVAAYLLPKKPSAVVPTPDGLRVHVGAKHTVLPLP